MGEVDRRNDFNGLEKTELLPVNARHFANHQAFGEDSAHAAGDNTVADLDLFLAEHEIEDQALPLATADTARPVALQKAGNSRGCVGNQKDPGEAGTAADNTTDHALGDNHRHALDDTPFRPLVDGDSTKPAGRIFGNHPGRQSLYFLGLFEFQQAPQAFNLPRLFQHHRQKDSLKGQGVAGLADRRRMFARAGEQGIEVELGNGKTERYPSASLAPELSAHVFERTGHIRRITVTIPADALFGD